MTSTIGSLCIECGLCCSGAIYDRVPLTDTPIDRAAEAFFNVYESEGQLYFAQPCVRLDGCCTVYDRRPVTCRTFMCGLASKLEQEAISLEDAGTIVATARDLVARIVARLPADVTIAAARGRWLRGDLEMRGDAALTLEMFALNRLLDRHFRKENQVVLRSAPVQPTAAPDRSDPPPSVA